MLYLILFNFLPELWRKTPPRLLMWRTYHNFYVFKFCVSFAHNGFFAPKTPYLKKPVKSVKLTEHCMFKLIYLNSFDMQNGV